MIEWLRRIFSKNHPQIAPTEDELAWKEKSWETLARVLVSAKIKPDEKIKEKVMAEFDQRIANARAIGKTTPIVEKEEVVNSSARFQIAHDIETMGWSFKALQVASAEGFEKARIYCDTRRVCENCKKLDGKTIRIAAILSTQNPSSIDAIHRVSSDENSQWCTGVEFHLIHPPKPRDDHKLAAWLEEHFKKETP